MVIWLVCSFRSLMAQATGSPAACASLTIMPISVQSTWLANALRTTCSALSTTGRLISTSSPFIRSTSYNTPDKISCHYLVKCLRHTKPKVACDADLCLVQGLQSLPVVPLNIFQLLHGLFLLMQGLHVNLLTLHLRKELIHCLSERITQNSYHILAKSVNLLKKYLPHIYLVKTIKFQIGVLCMLGKKEWMEFIISVSRHHKCINKEPAKKKHV